ARIGVDRGLGRALADLRALLIHDDRVASAPHPTTGAPRPGRVELSSLGFVLARERAGRDEGFLFTVRGGHNGESHNHNDLGALAVFLDGCPVIVDPGRVTYTAHSFSDTRYQEWAYRSSWHSVPSPRGLEQGTGREFRALGPTRVGSETSPRGWRVELSHAYPLGADEDLERYAALDPAEPSAVVIEDRWDLQSGADTLLHFMVVGEPRKVTDTFVEVGPGLLEHGSERVTWEPAPADDPYQRVDWAGQLYRLTFAQSSKIRGGTSRITVRRRTNDTRP
uniref:heparinase II/III domain-containing protein n=2 Tax=Timonella senegalensis TaxID=1465825 RepID=UPI002FE3B5CD